MYHSNYEWVLRFLPDKISSIVEVGSRDALDAIFLSKHYKCPVLSFEPNPFSYAASQQNLKQAQNVLVNVRPEALSNTDGPINFGAVYPEHYPNPGASSMFEIDFSNRAKGDPDLNRPPIQTTMVVNAARWDSFDFEVPELLVMDCEGAELKALQGFGSQLDRVHFVVVEVSTVAIGKGACTFKEVNSFLKARKFRLIASNTASKRPLLFARMAYVTIRNRLRRPLGKPLRGLSFDALYARQ